MSATDYLLKPFSKERFNDAVNKALSNFKNDAALKNKLNNLITDTNYSKEYLERIAVKHNNKISIIPSEDVEYFEAQDDYVMIYTSKGKYLKKKTMKFFEENLNPDQFIRVHRSYIAKIDQIEKFESAQSESSTIDLKRGQTLPVSKTGYSKLKEFFKVVFVHSWLFHFAKNARIIKSEIAVYQPYIYIFDLLKLRTNNER